MAPVAAVHRLLPWLEGRLHPTRSRMLWAVAASALLHAWVAEHIPAGATRARSPVLLPTLQARLAESDDPSDPLAGRQREVQGSAAEPVGSPSAAERRPGNNRPRARSSPPLAPPPLTDGVPEQEQASLAPAPLDPVYYSARELDVYPTPLEPLRFEYPAHLARTPLAGNVRVKVMVSESGAVDSVAVVAAEPAGWFEEHTRAALMSARFYPGRRAGRTVRSQITVNVDYDPAARAAVSR